MVTVTISPAGQPPALARNLPITLVIDKPLDKATVEDVKIALAKQFPKVRHLFSLHVDAYLALLLRIVLSVSSENHSER